MYKELNRTQKKELMDVLKNKYDDKAYAESEYKRITNSVVCVWEDIDVLEDFVYGYIENLKNTSEETTKYFEHVQWSIDYKHYFYCYLSHQNKYYYLENARIVIECE